MRLSDSVLVGRHLQALGVVPKVGSLGKSLPQFRMSLVTAKIHVLILNNYYYLL